MEENIGMLWVYTRGLEMPRWKKQHIFSFSRDFADEKFNFVSLSFRSTEIDCDIGFIVRPTNFLLIDIPSLIRL
jgi:hypothetical protein